MKHRETDNLAPYRQGVVVSRTHVVSFCHFVYRIQGHFELLVGFTSKNNNDSKVKTKVLIGLLEN